MRGRKTVLTSYLSKGYFIAGVQCQNRYVRAACGFGLLPGTRLNISSQLSKRLTYSFWFLRGDNNL